MFARGVFLKLLCKRIVAGNRTSLMNDPGNQLFGGRLMCRVSYYAQFLQVFGAY
jgi:hypothetical protein